MTLVLNHITGPSSDLSVPVLVAALGAVTKPMAESRRPVGDELMGKCVSTVVPQAVPAGAGSGRREDIAPWGIPGWVPAQATAG